MPEEFKFNRGLDDFPSWFLVHCTVELGDDCGSIIPMEPGQPIIVSLTMNGVELPVRQTLEHWNKFLDGMVKNRAEELLKERMSEFLKLPHELEGALRDKAKELGFNLEK